eukprot:TRINITY_DN11063_c0_g1_i1.p1 TRINITY_DN11063_c0_g1~~TRINITY_DN11063_c0_g1_i1.p1  ORF type:complete len:937 (-),score=356.19 TRINITY_DN11063_c0_g1_i1:3-2813(-)
MTKTSIEKASAQDATDVVFKIHYKVDYGKSLGLILHNKANPSETWDFRSAAIPMIWTQGDIWATRIRGVSKTGDYVYNYIVIENSQGGNRDVVRRETYTDRVLPAKILGRPGTVEIRDTWKDELIGPEKVFTSAAFTEVLFAPGDSRSELEFKSPTSGNVAVVFEIKHQLAKGYHNLMLSGSSKELGKWNTKNSIPMIREGVIGGETLFRAVVEVDRKEGFPFEYKLFEVDSRDESIAWEKGPNRHSGFDYLIDAQTVMIRDQKPFGRSFKGAGLAVPVFSLRTQNSLGVGEFTDIPLLVDWALSAGLSLVQILPINSTVIHKCWWDSYPYSSLSVFALHPIYINIEKLDPPKSVLEIIAENKKELNKGFLDYERVLSLKTELLKTTFATKKAEFLKSAEFAAFLQENEDWLPAYALFCHFRDTYGTSNFNNWPKYDKITESEIKELTKTSVAHYDTIAFEYYVQFHLSKQLAEVSEDAKKKGIVLKGDLPIGVDPCSVDTWVNRDIFHTDFQAGAPPDEFSEDGQNWGFPTYNWEAMEENGFQWWRRRLEVMSKFFHAYRIDHILGFFRIWQIPQSCEGALLGYFHPAIPIKEWELTENGVHDIGRLVTPHVTWDHLRAVFPHDSVQNIVDRFFNPIHGTPNLAFKAEFATEVQLSRALKAADDASAEEKEWAASTKKHLFKLMRNVVLIRDPSEQANLYHPRINCTSTDSFQSLPQYTKHAVYQLYISYFFKRQDDLWKSAALQRLQMMLDASKMMICGEDLGMIPNCVQSVIDELSILGLRIQRMPKDEKINFEDLDACPYMTVSSPSTHDTSSLRGWWEEDRAKTANFYYHVLKESGPVPYYCEPWVAEKIINQHLNSPSMWVIFALQDIFAMSPDLRLHENPKDERVNDPANRHHYWRYRIPFTLEDLISKHASFTNKIKATNAFFDRLNQ